MDRGAIERRLGEAKKQSVELTKEIDECQRLLAEPVEEWVECSAGEAFERLIAGKPVQATVFRADSNNAWADVYPPNDGDSERFRFDTNDGLGEISLSWDGAAAWKWRILAKDKPREVVLGHLAVDHCLPTGIGSNALTSTIERIKEAVCKTFERGTNVAITIKEDTA